MELTINLPEHLRSYIREQVEAGRFESEEAVIADAVEQAMDDYRWEDDAELLEAIAEADRGEGVEWTTELRKRIREQSETDARNGVPVPYDVTY